MTDTVTGTDVAIVPAAPASSLSPAAAADKTAIEGWIGDKSSPYWRGDGTMSAAQIQAHYRDLIRAEQGGKANPLGPPHEGVDVDMPSKPEGYSLEGLHIYNAADRDIVDLFLTHAHDSGFGQARTREALQWALSQPAGPPNKREFHKWAAGRGWSDTHIKRAIEFYDDERKRRK